VTRISELGTTLAETSVFTRVTRRNIPEDTILHSHRLESLKSLKLFRILCCLALSLFSDQYSAHPVGL
jgi:hypothetical protein